MRVLDVATGTGIVALAASRQVHAGDHCGHVLGVDLSQDMLAKVNNSSRQLLGQLQRVVGPHELVLASGCRRLLRQRHQASAMLHSS